MVTHLIPLIVLMRSFFNEPFSDMRPKIVPQGRFLPTIGNGLSIVLFID